MSKLDFYILGFLTGLLLCASLLLVAKHTLEEEHLYNDSDYESYNCVSEQVEIQSCSLRLKD